MRLIDADALEQRLTAEIESEEQDGNYFNVESLDRAREYVIDTPTVTLEQAEKAVAGVQERCKAEMIDILQEIIYNLEVIIRKTEPHNIDYNYAFNDGVYQSIDIIRDTIKEYTD